MSDVKQREVRMSGRKKGGNKPRSQRRVHKSIKLGLFHTMQRRYKRGMDARIAVRVLFPERVHDSKKDPSESGGDTL